MSLVKDKQGGQGNNEAHFFFGQVREKSQETGSGQSILSFNTFKCLKKVAIKVIPHIHILVSNSNV